MHLREKVQVRSSSVAAKPVRRVLSCATRVLVYLLQSRDCKPGHYIYNSTRVKCTSLTGAPTQDFRPGQGSKRKRGSRPQVDEASTSFESLNYFAVLSESESDTEDAASPTPSHRRSRAGTYVW